MLRQTTSRAHTAAIVGALVCMSLLTASCGKSEQSNTSATPASTPAKPSAAGSFEGLIAMRMADESQPGKEMVFYLKDSNTRVETNVGNGPEGEAVMLMDIGQGKVTTLMPSRKIYMTMDFNAASKGMDQDAPKFPKLTPTGRQETIAGHPCEHWLMGDEQEIDMCVAKGLGYFGMGGGNVGSLKNLAFGPKLLEEAAAHPEWVKFLEGGAFPLKATITEGGQVTMSMEATRIERKSLDASLFAVPPDYKELGAPNMPAGKR